ncbi:hypothetical protein VHEMI05626 [[Torrubiella] hemipterigena]|uniref:Uncharacterized protein n=1 Tax=[Torrubiella] hemipterigena TaxID=1531966 RepID=A0A0A1TJ69_9HYPO|nr:hypothetical protein VHEMI05626 [[Torrubiella] hemipterigena]
MYNNKPHPLLEQVPLTVSPFVSLPAATTLSYNYKTMPSNIPPSSLGIPTASDNPSQQPKPRYVVSNTGHAAHPDDIIASCKALHAHVIKLQEDADRDLREFDERIKERDLAEKRRLAPGWLDSDARLLEPQKSAQENLMDSEMKTSEVTQAPPAHDQGAELDRAFGGMELK